MQINLLYNKIVADTASEGFVESFNKIAFPKLQEKFPDVDEVIIYEDYLSDSLMANGIFYCPLTLVKDERVSRAYASWRCDAKRFENSIPYSYRGKELLNIDVSDSAPAQIEAKLQGRMPHFANNAIKLRISAAAPTKTFLSGKYSQSFVDIMRENLTCALEREFNIKGVDKSSLEITLNFAPESFMEHVLDNSSYRRVLISASACAPRDLWIKWTRLDGRGTYTISNHVSPAEISFELCDEVPEKIREREYRYLLKNEGNSAYKSAMSRKNFTEWRELVKRVIKRGEVLVDEENILMADPVPTYLANSMQEEISNVSIPEPSQEPIVEMGELTLSSAPKMDDEDDAFDSEISLKLQSVLGNYNIESEEPDVADEEEDINPDITELLRALISGNTEDNSRANEPSLENYEENEASMGTEEDELPPFDLDEEDSSVEELEEDSEPEVEREAEVDVEDTDDGALAEEIPEETTEETIEETVEETVDEVACEEKEIPTPVYRIIDDYVNSSEADEKIASLMEMNEELSLKLRETEAEKEKLLELVSSYEKRMEDARRERITLIENLDAAKRREERERERLAEAAKLAVAERGDEDKPVYPDEPVSAPVTLPKPVIEEPVAPSEPEAPSAPEKAPEEPAPVRYVSKVADISFRHPVDPNITKRIQDIIVTTVKYFGKENVYMKIKASIPDNYMVRLEFVKIPENESELLNDIIRVLGHSKLGITKVLLD